MSDIKATVKENLIRLRHENKLTQLELSQKINYSDKAVSRWETGEVTPDVETLAALAALYDVPITTFFLPADAVLAKRERHAFAKLEKRKEKVERKRSKAERKEEKATLKQERDLAKRERALAKKGQPRDPAAVRRTAIFVCALCMLWSLIPALFFYLLPVYSHAFCIFIWGAPLTLLALLFYLFPKANRVVLTVFFSIFVWTLLTAIYVQIAIWSLFPILFIGVPLQALILLFSYLKKQK